MENLKALWDDVARAGMKGKTFSFDSQMGFYLPLEKVVAKTAQHVDLVHLGDTDHRDPAIPDWLGRRETMKDFAEAGISDLFLEIPQSMQETFDDLAAGKITKSRFIDDMVKKMNSFHRDGREHFAAMATITESAAAFGIKVHCADPGNGMTLYNQFWNDVQAGWGGDKRKQESVEKIINEPGRTPLERHMAFSEFKENLETAFKEMPDEWGIMKKTAIIQTEVSFKLQLLDMKDRLENDESTADFIQDRLGGRKGVVLYGAAHGMGANDLDENLRDRGVSSVKIDIYASSYRVDELSIRPPFRPHADPAEAYFILEKNQAVLGTKLPVDLAAEIAGSATLYPAAEDSPSVSLERPSSVVSSAATATPPAISNAVKSPVL